MTYKILRFFADSSEPTKVIMTGLSLDDAKSHCNDSKTHKESEWFDGFEEE